MTSASSSNGRSVGRFIRWTIYTQLGSIAIGVVASYLPTDTIALAQVAFGAAFFWLLASAYVYPFLVLGWIILCGKPIAERILVMLAGAILIYVQMGVVILLH
jgi:hypothetical protein